MSSPAPLVTPGFLPIMPLQFLAKDGGLKNGCTAWSLNEPAHLYVTAAHCVLGEDGAVETVFLGGRPAPVVAVNAAADLAIVRAYGGAPALLLATRAPKADDVIRVVGHPYGWPGLVAFPGVLVSPGMDIGEGVFAIFDMTCAPGCSGSPVLKGERVVSVLQIGFPGAGRLSGGAPYDALIAVLEPFAPKRS